MKKLSLIAITLIIGVSVMAQQRSQTTSPQWTSIISNSPEAFQTRLISSTENSIKVNVQVPGFYTTTVTTPQGEANVITVPKSLSTAQAGEPNVPMTGIPVMIGDQARMNARVLDAQYMDFENIEVAPSKGDFPRTIDPETVPYTYGECYSQDAFFPSSNLDLYEPYIIRDFRGQNMAVYPFAYNPVAKTLRVYYNMTVELYKVDDNGKNTMPARKSNTVKMDSDFKSVYQRHFINYAASMAKYTPLDEEGDLLIICHDDFICAMTNFVNWKKTRGINTTIVGTSTAGTTAEAIKTYIQNQYNANNNLTHVLLVGDVDQIPGYSYSGGGSNYSGLGDNPYGQIVGNDIYNDVIIGRFSASTAARVATQCNRVITYERDLTSAATWCQNGLGISTTSKPDGHYDERDYEHIENLRTDLLNYGYSTVYQDYYNVSGFPESTTGTISDHINSGVGIINYCNHGEETGWQSHNYMNSHVNALTNENKLPFIFSVACFVGKYDHDSDCFAEAWMNATINNNPTGAIGGMFSYIKQSWIPPMWAQDEFVDILVESYNNNIKHTSGGTAINSLFAIFDHYSPAYDEMAVGTYQAWVHYGDPTLMLRTKAPQSMTITHADTITPGGGAYTVNVSNGNGTVATITDANHNILGKATVNNGVATVNVSGNLTVGTELTLCVFGYNKMTYTGYINVVEGTQYNITCVQPQHGTISVPSQAYANAIVTLTAMPETGYCFSGWTVTDANNQNIVVTNNQFTMPESAVTVTATFITGLNVTLAPVTNGTISADPTCVLQGTTINLTAIPATGYVFDSWVVYKTGDANTTITITDNSFTMPNYPVTVSAIFNEVMTTDVTIGSGNSSKNVCLPTHSRSRYSLTQQIYNSSEMDGAGTITKIAFKVSNSKSTDRKVDIYMSHTTKDSFTSETDWVLQSTSDRVFWGHVTFATSGWTTITLDTPFEYDGTSNLLLTVDDNTGTFVATTNSPEFYTYSTSSNTAIYKNTSEEITNYNPASMSTAGTLLQSKNQIVLTKEVPIPEGYLSVSPTSLSGFNAVAGVSASEPQNVTVIGRNLQADLTVTAPTGYEVSTASGGTYNSTLTLTPSYGSLNANVFVRLSSSMNPSNFSGDMTLTSGTTAAAVSLNGKVFQTFTKEIAAWGEGNGWYLIASPLADATSVENVDNLINTATPANYDLYRFNQSAGMEWENHKVHLNDSENPFNALVSGQGYLYANAEDVMLFFTGMPYNGDGKVTLTNVEGHRLSGWNLIGNPFNATATISKDFYRMNEDRDEIIAAEDDDIAPMEGIFVYTETSEETITFSAGAKRSSDNKEQVVVNLRNNGGNVIDRAIVRMGEGETLPKFQIKDNSTKLYISQNGKDYAIVTSEGQGEFPLNLKANENGNYTISVNPENVEMAYLHLIDNLTGADVDLLQTPSYAFTAKTTDYASRFKLVFATGNATEDNFAFFSSDNIIVNGTGMLQVIDVLGRQCYAKELSTANCQLSTINFPAGVYVLRLIGGDVVRTQKIVVR